MFGLTDKEIFEKYFELKEVNKMYIISDKETKAKVFSAKSKPMVRVKCEALVEGLKMNYVRPLEEK